MRPEVDTTTITTHFAADRTSAKLIWHRSTRVDRETDCTAVAGAVKGAVRLSRLSEIMIKKPRADLRDIEEMGTEGR